MKIDITKEYTTREGREVRILCVDRNSRRYPVLALVEGNLNTYTSNGSLYYSNKEDNNDLIPKKKKVKYLKSVPELMEEFPNAYFDEGGRLHLSTVSGLLATDLHKCNKPTTGYWSDRLIKEVEED